MKETFEMKKEEAKIEKINARELPHPVKGCGFC